MSGCRSAPQRRSHRARHRKFAEGQRHYRGTRPLSGAVGGRFAGDIVCR